MTPLATIPKWSDGFRASDLPLRLRFGTRQTTLRYLCPGDAARLTAFFASHTPDTIHSRDGLFIHMSPEHATQLVGVNQSRDCALGVFENRGGALIAIGRYCPTAGDGSAELAFVVRENRRGLGIATALLRVLQGVARERGPTKLTAQVEPENHAMPGIFRRAGAGFTGDPRNGATAVTLGLVIDLLQRPPIKPRAFHPAH
jgi:ribosomal protein S18 acetylase RimI-like enzyme